MPGCGKKSPKNGCGKVCGFCRKNLLATAKKSGNTRKFSSTGQWKPPLWILWKIQKAVVLAAKGCTFFLPRMFIRCEKVHFQAGSANAPFPNNACQGFSTFHPIISRMFSTRKKSKKALFFKAFRRLSTLSTRLLLILNIYIILLLLISWRGALPRQQERNVVLCIFAC